MIANAIAFFLAATFFLAGVYGFCRVGQGRIPEEKEGPYIAVSFLFILVAWGCAKMGGI